MAEIRDPQIIYASLRDLMTVDEILALEQRRDIAQRIHAGETYKHIEAETWASSTTIARVAKYLHGKNGWYTYMLQNQN